MLLEDRRRRLFLGGIIKRVANVVKKVVSPVVKAVRTAGPYIGAAVGGVGGFIVGGPAGAFAGAKTGYKIGSLAKSFVNACIPRNSFRLRCDKRQLLMNGVQRSVQHDKTIYWQTPIKDDRIHQIFTGL
jgi:hypothetical protein